MAYQQQQRPLRRLLENFEQGIRSRPIELVDRIDDGDPPAALSCGRAEERNRAAHVVGRDLLAQHIFLVRHALENEKIAMRLRGHTLRHRVFRIDGERARRMNGWRGWVRMREHEARHPISKRRLADTVLADQHEGMRYAAAAISGKQRRLRAAVTKERAGL